MSVYIAHQSVATSSMGVKSELRTSTRNAFDEGCPIWLVAKLSNVDTLGAVVYHSNFDSAEKKAQALAEDNPGTVYFVLRSTHAYCTPKPKAETILLTSKDTSTESN